MDPPPARRLCREDRDVVQFEFLRAIVGLLDASRIPYMVAGSMASTFHGEPRMTRDIDLVVEPTAETIGHFAESLDRSRYYAEDLRAALRRRDMANVLDTTSGWKADLIIRKDRPFSRKEFERRTPADLDGHQIYVATAEDTVLAKLEWRADSGFEQQWRDVIAVIETQELDLGYMRFWAAQLQVSDELERALAEAQT